MIQGLTPRLVSLIWRFENSNKLLIMSKSYTQAHNEADRRPDYGSSLAANRYSSQKLSLECTLHCPLYNF